MISLNPEVNALHAAFNSVSGRELPMTFYFERQWLEANQNGVTPQDVEMVYRERLKQQAPHGDRKPGSLLLRAFCGSESAIADLMDEASMIKARGRVRKVDPARASILRQTGRPAAEPGKPAVAADHLPLIEQLRKAAQ